MNEQSNIRARPAAIILTPAADADSADVERLEGLLRTQQEVLSNLLENACKYTRRGMISIGVRWSRRADDIEIEDDGVSATGVGRRDEFLARRILAGAAQRSVGAVKSVEGVGFEVVGSTPDEFAAHIRAELERDVRLSHRRLLYSGSGDVPRGARSRQAGST